MKIDNLIEGLQILKKYYSVPDGYHIGAEHDEFHAYATDIPVGAEDIKRMVDLGWFQDYESDDNEDEFTPDQYDQEETWKAYV